MKKIIISVLMTAALSMILAGCSIDLNIPGVNNIQNNKYSARGEATGEFENTAVDNLRVKNETGNVHIRKIPGQKPALRLEIKVDSSSQKEAEDILGVITVVSEINGDTNNVRVINKETKADFWAWKNDNYTGVNVSVAIYLDIASDFKAITVDNITGDINMTDLNGIMTIRNTTGNISLRNTNLSGRNQISLTTGNIVIDAGLKDAEMLEVSETTGNLDIVFPSDVNASVEAEVTTGSIGGSFVNSDNGNPYNNRKFTGKLNGGGCGVILRTVTGNINILKK